MGWREELLVALRSWRALEDAGANVPSWRRVGGAIRGRRPGEFVVDIRGSQLSMEQLQAESLRLGESDRTTAGNGHSVMEVTEQGGAIRVHVAEFADPVEPTLWLYQQPPTFLIDSLIDGIAGITDERLAGSLARGELGGELAPVSPADEVLLPAQQHAYRACSGRGLWMVWGPPGTGKTSVLTRAIIDLMAVGRRILLVSATNIAVDNVVVKVAPAVRGTPGQVVRVGTPHLKEVAADNAVCLPLLVRARLDDIERQRTHVAAELTAIAERDIRRKALADALVDFDFARYRRAQKRLQVPELSPEVLSVRIDNVTCRHTDAAAAAQAAEAAAAQASRQDSAVSADRARWRDIDAHRLEKERLEAELSSYDIEVARRSTALAKAEEQLRKLENGTAWARFRDRKARSDADAEVAALRRDLAAAVAAQASVAEPAGLRIGFLDKEIERITAFTEVGRAEINRFAREHQAAESLRRKRTALLQQTSEELHTLSNELELTKAAEEEVLSAVRRGFPAKYAEHELLSSSAEADSRNADVLRKQHQELEEQYRALAQDAQGKIIRSARLVATTLARFRTTPAAVEGPYDVVLVDEVGAGALPDVLTAVAAAGRTAVLLGDFMQLGPVVPQALRSTDRSDMRRWLCTEVFDHCGIDTARAAQDNPGCITLDVQHRFGPTVMELANRIAYDGILKAGPGIEARTATTNVGDAEIVLVDTDGLTDLGHIYRAGRAKGWWPAGVLLARAIAEMHVEDGTTIGVVTPYTLQVDATLEAMREVEIGGAMIAEVGTAHRFQGREFGVVIFDLVESADGEGMWMARAGRGARGGQFARDGLRLFNVAVTRVQQRIYLIGSLSRIERASRDTALGELAVMLEGRKVRRLAATDLIAPFASPDRLGPVGSRLAEVLSRHVEVSDIQDEITFYETFAGHLEAARESIWIWSPWTANRLRTLLPVLADAAARGVRIVVFVRDPDDKIQTKFQDLVDELAAVVDSIVCVHEMHQKIIVIDDRLVMLGSLNVLSQSSTREVMLTMRGSHFAKKILSAQHAGVFSRPPRCGGCRKREVDLKRRRNGNWYWRCRNRACPARKGNRAWVQDLKIGETVTAGRGRR
ncbi:AAA domain-containing protein [Nocardia shimofusensis]|uniref:AAA domain-containing protein n=1 Tax=Nocardia shimofusensis TaxID=228596 RepID=UPI000834C5C3|nr:AAA domain-containing protein [Nocardia shimofusensis]